MREDKEFTQFWHNNAIGMWERWLPLDKLKNGLEIGSFEGASAVWLMDHAPNLKLTCVDIFGPAFDDITGEYEKRFERNVAEYGKRIRKLKGNSADVLKKLKGNKYDLIYIDGSHTYEDALLDAQLAYPLLKKGGIMIFDDYNNADFGVKQAVDEFLENAENFEVLREEEDYQMAIRRL